MKQSLQLRLGQQLTMTPQLQQAIRLLQLSTLELRTEIQQAIESNMMLEMSEDGGGGEGGAEADWGTESGAERSTAEQKKITEDRSNNESDVDLQQSDMPDDLPVDSAWEDVFDSGPTYSRQQDLEGREFEHQDESSESLHEHLLWQMRLTPFSETDVAIATSIIDSISDDGYLDTTAENFQGAIGVTKSGPDSTVEGVDVVVPVFNFTVTKVWPENNLPSLGTIYSLTGKVNSGPFSVTDTETGLTISVDTGECLFNGASFGGQRGDGGVEFTYSFSASANRTGITVGSIGGISKKGWEYMWVRYADAEGDTAIIKKPIDVHVEKVYELGNFGSLGL